MLALVVLVLDPDGEGAIEGVEARKVELPIEEALSNGAEEPLNFSLGGAVAGGSVTQDGADALTDLGHLKRRVVAAIVDIQTLAKATLVKGGLEGLEQRFGIVTQEELAVAYDAAGVIQERDELGLCLAGAVLHVGGNHGVGLPEPVGMRLGEG